jgi:hypothetical protein
MKKKETKGSIVKINNRSNRGGSLGTINLLQLIADAVFTFHIGSLLVLVLLGIWSSRYVKIGYKFDGSYWILKKMKNWYYARKKL